MTSIDNSNPELRYTLTSSPDDHLPVCPTCKTPPESAREEVAHDGTARARFDPCGHRFRSDQPFLGSAIFFWNLSKNSDHSEE